jgi:hypothetical protein
LVSLQNFFTRFEIQSVFCCLREYYMDQIDWLDEAAANRIVYLKQNNTW